MYFFLSKKIFLWMVLFFPTLEQGVEKQPTRELWGSKGHKQIVYYAIQALPEGMFSFYMKNMQGLMRQCVVPDRRKYVSIDEAKKHYINIEFFQTSWDSLPMTWEKAVAKYDKQLEIGGILFWHCIKMKKLLTQAFQSQDYPKILYLSAELSHYIADAFSPLHTTKNYDGILTNQEGIHKLWESILFEKYGDTYSPVDNYKAKFIPSFTEKIWDNIKQSYQSVDYLLSMEKKASQILGEKKYKGKTKIYSQAFLSSYHKLLHGQIENRYKEAIKFLVDVWYTCWVEAGEKELPK